MTKNYLSDIRIRKQGQRKSEKSSLDYSLSASKQAHDKLGKQNFPTRAHQFLAKGPPKFIYRHENMIWSSGEWMMMGENFWDGIWNKIL